MSFQETFGINYHCYCYFTFMTGDKKGFTLFRQKKAN